MHIHLVIGNALLTLFVTAAICATPKAAQADTAFDDGVNRLANKVAEFIAKEGGEKAILVGDFVGLPRHKSSGGVGIRYDLEQALKKHGLTVQEDAPFQLIGQFSTRDEKNNAADDFESVALRVTVALLNRDDVELQKFSISIFGDAALQIAGGTFDLPAHGSDAEREERERQGFEHPHAVVVGSETRSSTESQFGVEVRVRRGTGRESDPRLPDVIDGRSFVTLSQGEEYLVRLINRANFEAAVTLTVDGLNMFAFSAQGSFGRQVLVPARTTVEIPGWFITPQTSDAFEITTYAKSAASTAGVPTSSIGTITASFAAAWEPTGTPPADEVGAKGADAATGRGRQIDQAYVEVERVVGRVRSVISVRYNR